MSIVRSGRPSRDLALEHGRGVRLSVRELEILRLVSAGHRNQDAADILLVSKRTVEFHLVNMFSKLGVCNRMQAVRVAWRLGLLPFEPPMLTPRRY